MDVEQLVPGSRTLPTEIINSLVAYPREKRIGCLFEEQAARTPDAIAVVSGNERLTYRELDARTNRLARYLQRAGVGSGTLVGLAVDRSEQMLIAMLAILKAGGAYLPIDPDYPRARIELMIEDARLGFIVTTEQLRSILPASPARIISLDGDAEAIKTQSAAPVASSPAGNDLAYVIYTSGSTGKPKGVMVEHRNVVNFFTGMDRAIGAEPGVWLAVTSISFDISVLELLWTLTRGFRLVIHGEGSSDEIPAEIHRHGVTHLQSTPSLLRALASNAQSLDALGKLKKLLIGGEALPSALVASLRQSFTGELYNMYGPTETAIWSTVHRVQEQPSSIPIGKPIVNTQVYILDSQLNPVPAGEPGELFIGGDGVGPGYLHRPDLTAERFLADSFRDGGRLYRTGDIVRFLADGNLEYLGRADFQVKIRGFRIELGEIEAALEQQPGVEQAVVVAREDQLADKLLVAYFVAAKGTSVTSDALRRALEVTLPDYMVPSHFILTDRLPLTANGKIDRKALAPIPLPAHLSTDPGDNPRGEFEEFLAKAWAEALGLHCIRRHDNFFGLGGHSLAALKIAFQSQQEFHVDFPLQMFVQCPVLREQAKRLEDMVMEQADESVLDDLVSEVMQARQGSVAGHVKAKRPGGPAAD